MKLHPGQSEVFEEMFLNMQHRFFTVVCNRGWGKSFFASSAAVTAMYELIGLHRRIPNKHIYIIAPTHDQVIDIYYPILAYDYALDDLAKSCSKDRGRFVFENNTEIRLLSYEAIERLRGKGPYFVVWDEISSCTKGIKPKKAWEEIIQPAILSRWSRKNQQIFKTRRPGTALLIGTPKGFNFLYDAYNFEESDKDWKSFKYNYLNSPLTDMSEIIRIKANSDPISFASEYESDFISSGNRVFYCFDRKHNVAADLPYFGESEGNKEIINVGVDFNVGLMCGSLFALRAGQIHYLDEFFGSPNTEEFANRLVQRFPGHEIHAYPDPTGNARKTSAPVGATDFTILRSKGIKVFARDAPPPHVDSAKAVNRLLLNSNGDRSMYFHPRTKRTIESMEKTSWVDGNPDSATIDKSEGVEHYSDSVRYPSEYLFPIRTTRVVVAKSKHF